MFLFKKSGHRLSGYLFHNIRLERITLADIIELLNANTAFVTLVNLLNVVLETAERGNLILKDNDTVTDNTDGGLTGDLTASDVASCDNADTGNLNGLSDLGVSEENLLVGGSKHTLHSRLNLVYDLIDDTVSTDIYLITLSRIKCVLVGTYVEARDATLKK